MTVNTVWSFWAQIQEPGWISMTSFDAGDVEEVTNSTAVMLAPALTLNWLSGALGQINGQPGALKSLKDLIQMG